MLPVTWSRMNTNGGWTNRRQACQTSGDAGRRHARASPFTSTNAWTTKWINHPASSVMFEKSAPGLKAGHAHSRGPG
jgi:hypothetical protein